MLEHVAGIMALLLSAGTSRAEEGAYSNLDRLGNALILYVEGGNSRRSAKNCRLDCSRTLDFSRRCLWRLSRHRLRHSCCFHCKIIFRRTSLSAPPYYPYNDRSWNQPYT